MPATITPEERAMIDAKVAAGKVTRCPTGKSAFADEYVWEEGKGLVTRNPEMAKANFRRFTFGTRKGRPRPTPPAVVSRRDQLAELVAQGKSGPECAKILGVPEATMYADAKRHGIRFESRLEAARQARRARVLPLIKEGMSGMKIAAALGMDVKTVRSDARAMGVQIGKARKAA